MSSTEPKPKRKKPARAVNRWGVGTLSVLQLLLLAVSLLALNYLSFSHYKRKDLSRDGAYTLSPATKRYLESEEFQRRRVPVKWILAFRRSSPFYERVRALAEEYVRHSGGKIELERVDPLRSPDRTQQVMSAYDLSYVRDLLIMDARKNDSEPVSRDASGMRRLNPNVKLAVADEMNVYTTDRGQRKITGFQGEDVLTARLVEAVEGRPRKMLFLADKSRIDTDSEISPWKSLEKTLRFQNVELTPVNLAGMSEIPEDAEGVALVAPRYDLTDAELAVLEQYWQRPKAALLILLQAGEAPPKLRAFLRRNGVTPRRDRVVIRQHERTVSTVRAGFTAGVDFIKDLAGQTTMFEGGSSSLEVREGDEDLLNQRISAIPLVEVEEGFWGETNFGDGKEAYDAREDHAAPLYLAAAVTRGAATDDRFASQTSRMIVVSNTGFLDPENQRAETIDFLASSANWLMGRESLAGIGPRSLGLYKLPLLDAQVSFINRVNLFFLPALLLLLGGFVWSSRRA